MGEYSEALAIETNQVEIRQHKDNYKVSITPISGETVQEINVDTIYIYDNWRVRFFSASGHHVEVLSEVRRFYDGPPMTIYIATHSETGERVMFDEESWKEVGDGPGLFLRFRPAQGLRRRR